MQGIIGDVWDCIPHPAPNNHSTEICESLLSACPVFCCLTNRNPQGQFHIQFFEIFKISFTHEAGALWLRDEFSSSQPSETDGSV